MYTPTALITEDLFKLHSPITGNTDLVEFIPYLAIAQELYVTPLLGESLISELKNQIEKNELTEKNSELILKIAPALAFYAIYQGLPFHWASIVNKGITIRESENSRGVNIQDIAQLRRWIKDDAEIFVNLLIRFLSDNKKDYPLWKPKNACCADQNHTANGSFDSGFYFPDRK